MVILWGNLARESWEEHELSIGISWTSSIGVASGINFMRLFEHFFFLKEFSHLLKMFGLLSIILIVMDSLKMNVLLMDKLVSVMHKHFFDVTESVDLFMIWFIYS